MRYSDVEAWYLGCRTSSGSVLAANLDVGRYQHMGVGKEQQGSVLRRSIVTGGGLAEGSPLVSRFGDAGRRSSSAERVMMAPPFAERNSSSSLGGGSFPKKLLISKALHSSSASVQ